MIEANWDEPLLRPREVEQEVWLLEAAQRVEAWDRAIRRALANLSYCRWPQWLGGLIPARFYRLRYQQVDPQVHLWWVERAVADDRDKYEAYRVHLILDFQAQPVLIVQSGATVYPVQPPTVEALAAAMFQAGCDFPLVNHERRY